MKPSAKQLAAKQEADKAIKAVIDRASAMLYEHFDLVEIGVSWHDREGTHVRHTGSGNELGRKALAEEMANAYNSEEFDDDDDDDDDFSLS